MTETSGERRQLTEREPFADLAPSYATIVADPPWRYEQPMTAIDGAKRKPLPYSTMPNEEIAALPVGALAAPGAHLYLWTTDQHLWAARQVAESWGFRVAKVLAWCKPPSGFLMSGPFTNTTEFVIYGRLPMSGGSAITEAREAAGLSRKAVHAAVRGGSFTGLVWNWENDLSVPTEDDWDRLVALLPSLTDTPRPDPLEPIGRVDSTWWEWERGPHSAKPPAFLDVVERVSPGPYVELFSRAPRLGWDHWGHGYETTAELAS